MNFTNIKKRFFGLFLITGIALGTANADDNPLWESLSPDSFPNPTLVNSETPVDPSPPEPQAFSALSSVPEAVNAEIADLAQALNNDAVKIFNYVRNNIHYQHYHGIRKGAILTLLEGSGNDFDQCALLAELLKAAGHTNITYKVQGHRIDYANLVDWMGVASEPHPGKTFEQA